jgi:hypothetical protein
MGYNGACRREELVNITIDDIEFKQDLITVSIPRTKNYLPRLFAITVNDGFSLQQNIST